MTANRDDPHATAKIEYAGEPLERAAAVLIMIHGRGGSAHDMLALWEHIESPGVAVIAPEAVGNTWYPHPFLVPRDQNEPWASSALALVRRQVDAAESAGFPSERVFLLGFSQGACLTTQFTAENPTRYAGVFGLSGGLIGPQGTTFSFSGDLEGTPVYLGCSDVDPHIPAERVRETRDALAALGGEVTMQLFEGAPHAVMPDEIEVIRSALASAAK